MSSRTTRQNRSGATRSRGTSSYDEARAQRRGSQAARSSAPRWPLPFFLILVFGVIVLRLLWLQVIDSPNLKHKAELQHNYSVDILAKRGTIYDRNGNVLATSVECQTIYCNPNAITPYTETADDDETTVAQGRTKAEQEAAQILSEVLGGDVATYQDILNIDTTYYVIEKRVDDDVADELMDKLSEAGINGIYSLDEVKRVYPYGSVAGQLIGFVGDEGTALSGLELYYDDILSGENGEMIMEHGSNGEPIAGGVYEIHEAKDGIDIVLSIDVNIQKIAEEKIAEGIENASASAGNVVVSDPSTGEILAACSTPLYDPTDSSTLTNEALNLSCVSSSYEPGSTFKPIMVAIGYDAGVFARDTVYNVPAEVTVGDDVVTDVGSRDYALDMTPTEIIRRSSNTGAALLGMAIGADTFAEGLTKFGIGSKTGVDFPGESAGIVTSRSEYTGASVGSMSFGQGLAFPSIQLVRAIGAIANDGTITTPHFLVQKAGEEVEWPEGEQIISADAANMVSEDMLTVVNDEGGTGTEAQIAGYEVAGKTGTGEMASESGGYVEGSYLSSFIGFANASDPDILVYVGIYGTEQHGSTAAAPVFRAIMSEALTDLNVQPTN